MGTLAMCILSVFSLFRILRKMFVEIADCLSVKNRVIKTRKAIIENRHFVVLYIEVVNLKDVKNWLFY